MTTGALSTSSNKGWQGYLPDVKKIAFQTASYLTDPACKSHEFFRRFQVVDHLNPGSYVVVNWVRKFFLGLGVVGFASLAAVTTLPAMLLRNLACRLQRVPFIYLEGGLKAKTVGNAFTLFSWNICGVGAGYAISDGGVIPWPFRIEGIIKKIQEKNADVICLSEVMDIKTGLHIYEAIKKDYCHFYLNIGPRTIGISSGLFIASKFAIKHPEFTPFPKEMLVGRTKNAEKGVFAFDVQSAGKAFARIFSTHLQHSEICSSPTQEEQCARKDEMKLIMDKINVVWDRAVVLTGDLNLDDKEYETSSWVSKFEKGASHIEHTWGGDEFYAKLVQKEVSTALNLDHTAVLVSSASGIETTVVQVGYDPKSLTNEALSDHSGLYTTITLKSWV
jgi:endonuclease/exonuclease/phosphatase family metal-dependent hydrolase